MTVNLSFLPTLLFHCSAAVAALHHPYQAVPLASCWGSGHFPSCSHFSCFTHPYQPCSLLPSYFPVSSLFLFSATQPTLLDQDSIQTWFSASFSSLCWEGSWKRGKSHLKWDSGIGFPFIGNQQRWQTSSEAAPLVLPSKVWESGKWSFYGQTTPTLQFMETIDHCRWKSEFMGIFLDSRLLKALLKFPYDQSCQRNSRCGNLWGFNCCFHSALTGK